MVPLQVAVAEVAQGGPVLEERPAVSDQITPGYAWPPDPPPPACFSASVPPLLPHGILYPPTPPR